VYPQGLFRASIASTNSSRFSNPWTIIRELTYIHLATEISDRAYVVEGGRVRYAGTMTDLEKQPEIKQKYLLI
jgi:ABC-type branched-subunit amino acid transport system ATPase component